jgi:hypothetical protein
MRQYILEIIEISVFLPILNNNNNELQDIQESSHIYTWSQIIEKLQGNNDEEWMLYTV